LKLIVAHRILIGSAIGLAVIFAVRAVVLFARGGGTGELAIGVGAMAVGVALSLYLRKIRRRK
jgi:hypothetical protein